MQLAYDIDDNYVVSANGWEAFQNSDVWADLNHFMTERLEAVNREIIHADDLRKIGFLQGEAASIRTFLGLPKFLAERAEIQIERNDV